MIETWLGADGEARRPVAETPDAVADVEALEVGGHGDLGAGRPERLRAEVHDVAGEPVPAAHHRRCRGDLNALEERRAHTAGMLVLKCRSIVSPTPTVSPSSGVMPVSRRLRAVSVDECRGRCRGRARGARRCGDDRVVRALIERLAHPPARARRRTARPGAASTIRPR